jgi:DNA-binding transcriptional LysR family regulator
MGFAISRDDFMVRTDNQTVLWEMVKAGLGVGFAQDIIRRHTKGMVALLPDFHPPSLEVWLTTHRELLTSRRIRTIYDRLATLLTAYYTDRPTTMDI